MAQHYGDLNKTDNLYNLCKVPDQQRATQWREDFFENLAGASLSCGKPQVVTNAYELPYFQLLLPNPGEEFECFVIENLLDFLLKNGIGVVINPNKSHPDWVLTYGDILNLYLNKTFYSPNTLPHNPAETNTFTIPKGTTIFQGDPSELIIPPFTRSLIKSFLVNNGVHSPKLVLCQYKYQVHDIIDLLFNFTPHDCKDTHQFNNLLHVLQWFLPKHYTVSATSEKDSGMDFFSL